MKIIISESQYHFIRRKRIAENVVKDALEYIYTNENFCVDWLHNKKEFIDEVFWLVWDRRDDLNITSKGRIKIEEVFKFLNNNFYDFVAKSYDEKLKECEKIEGWEEL